MKIISPIFDSMRGKLGGCVGAVSRGGVAYLRSRVIPSNPRSLAQSTMRLITTSLAAAWRSTLSDTQRAGWEALATGGESGIDVYVKSNSLPLLNGLARTDNPPASVSLAATPVTAITVSAGDPSVTTNEDMEDNVFGAIFLSRQQHASRGSQQFNFTYAGSISPSGDGFMIPANHPALPLTVGEVVYVRLVKYGSPSTGDFKGQTANEQIFRCVVAA